ncbi:MAG: trypsin-like peptidase domain-containing protein, partial [Candidatus Kapabacteria bacterium]|nr:trypsin-like peptidase domain-containing protein [Candidatus Kapabacteria bacterium]
MSKRTLLTAVALIGTGIVFGVVLMTSFGGNAIENLFAGGSELGATMPPAPSSAAVKALNDQFVAVSSAVTQSVVSISVKTERKASAAIPKEFYRFFGPDGSEGDPSPQPDEGEAAGSGVVISADGYVVTNNHVVESAKEGGIVVTTNDQKEYKARLVGRDPLTDLAVLKIDGTFMPAHFAQRAEIRVGEWVVAVGNPLGLKSTVTTGIVSAMGRGIGIVGTDDQTFERNRYAVENFIQTDAAINPGNSGGGLFNLNGSLVGINTAIASRSGFNAGYGFAIPIDMVRSVALDLIDDGKIQRGYIGVEITSVDEASAKAVGLGKVSGVNVNKVVRGGAAESAGIEVGDVILDVDGNSVKTSNDLQNEIVVRRAGDKVNLRIWRDGREITKSVTLKSLDGDYSSITSDSKAGEATTKAADEPVNFKSLGFTANTLTEEQNSSFGTKNGVFISKVDRGGAVARRGLRPGTVILKADGKEVNSPNQLQRILGSKKAGDGVLFVVKESDGTKQA